MRVAEKAVDTALHAADIALNATQESVQKVHRTVSNYSDSRYGGTPVYEANGTPPPEPQPVQTPHKPKTLDQKNKAIQPNVNTNRPIIRERVKSVMSVGITVVHLSVAKTIDTIVSPNTFKRRL